MTTQREELDRLIIKNQSVDGSIDISDLSSLRDDVLILLQQAELRGRIRGMKQSGSYFQLFGNEEEHEQVNAEINSLEAQLKTLTITKEKEV